MILIKLKHMDGSIETCSARCYDSFKKKCTCICRGINHGKGENPARLLTFEQVAPMLRSENPYDRVVIPDKARQEEFNL